MNKTARDMFLELGYEIDSTHELNGHLFYYSSYSKIDFDLVRQDFYKYSVGGTRSPITMELLKAINKQVEELGWNNE